MEVAVAVAGIIRQQACGLSLVPRGGGRGGCNKEPWRLVFSVSSLLLAIIKPSRVYRSR